MPEGLGFYIGGRFVAYYGLLIVAGIAVAVFVGWRQTRRHGLDFNDLIVILAVCGLFGIVGAKLLYLLVSWRQIHFDQLLNLDYLSGLMQGGFVFYGGLLGGLLGLVCCRRCLRIQIQPYLNAALPCLPLAHGFGRIGCAVVGCCYGRPYGGPLAVCYEHSLFAPNHILLFPVQALEAALLLCLALGLLAYVNHFSGKRCLQWYVFLYAAVRFVLEFLRYDDQERGMLLFFSVSQWISLALILGVLAVRWIQQRRARQEI